MENLTHKERNYFIATGFFNYKSVSKWKSNIRIAIKGNDIRQDDRTTIDTLIHEVTKLIQPLKISYAEKTEDANVVFVLDKDMSNPTHAYGLVNPKLNFFNRNKIVYAEVLIFPTSSDAHRKRVIYHEMMHVLGLNHPKFLNQHFEVMNSILTTININRYEDLNNYLETHHKFSELDKKMLRMLYSPCISLGMGRTELFKIIQNHDPQVNNW